MTLMHIFCDKNVFKLFIYFNIFFCSGIKYKDVTIMISWRKQPSNSVYYNYNTLAKPTDKNVFWLWYMTLQHDIKHFLKIVQMS